MSVSSPSELGAPAPPALPDLMYAAALAGAAERMGAAADLGELWPRLAEEALTLIPADGALVAERPGRSWTLLATRTDAAVLPLEQAEHGLAAAERQGLLAGAGAAHHQEQAGSADGWRSVLAVPIDRRPSRVPTRLLWFTGRPDGLQAYAALADLVGHHAGTAARAVHGRETLGRAVDARNRIGQAQGILMARHRLTAEQAFALLVRHSQTTNTKLRILAEDVILTGRLGEAG